MRIVLVGQGPFGEKVLEALLQRREEVVGVFCPPDKRGDPLAALAGRSGIPLFRPARMKDPQVYQTYEHLKPDLVMLAFVTDIIPESLIDLPTIGTVCYHPIPFAQTPRGQWHQLGHHSGRYPHGFDHSMGGQGD